MNIGGPTGSLTNGDDFGLILPPAGTGQTENIITRALQGEANKALDAVNNDVTQINYDDLGLAFEQTIARIKDRHPNINDAQFDKYCREAKKTLDEDNEWLAGAQEQLTADDFIRLDADGNEIIPDDIANTIPDGTSIVEPNSVLETFLSDNPVLKGVVARMTESCEGILELQKTTEDMTNFFQQYTDITSDFNVDNLMTTLNLTEDQVKFPEEGDLMSRINKTVESLGNKNAIDDIVTVPDVNFDATILEGMPEIPVESIFQLDGLNTGFDAAMGTGFDVAVDTGLEAFTNGLENIVDGAVDALGNL